MVFGFALSDHFTSGPYLLIHPSLKVQCKEVKNTTGLLSVIMLLIE